MERLCVVSARCMLRLSVGATGEGCVLKLERWPRSHRPPAYTEEGLALKHGWIVEPDGRLCVGLISWITIDP
jgi:hypothetical protein